MDADVVALLACPYCRRPLSSSAKALHCSDGHLFDIARQGYVNLRGAVAGAGIPDTADMVAARVAFLERGHFVPLRRTLQHAAHAAITATADGVAAGGGGRSLPDTARRGLGGSVAGAVGPADAVAHGVTRTSGAVIDLGGGTGYHTAAVLDGLPDSRGLIVDLSKHAARRAAQVHRRAGAVVADVWRRLPVQDGVAALALSVFAPRNTTEIARVLRSDGRLVVATPEADHLAPLVNDLGLLTVEDDKGDRLDRRLAPQFRLAEVVGHRHVMRLVHDDIRALVAMGPSAWHVDQTTVDARLRRVPEPVDVQVAARVATYRRT